MDSQPLDKQLVSPEDGTTFLAYEQQPFSFFLKRLLDYVGSAVILIAVSPIMAIAALLIKLDSPGSVLFRQTRTGRFNKPFTIYKFRTMIVGAEKGNSDVFKDDPRITRIGNFLRNTSLDELPQLFNILKGEMSLVGPRPTLPEQVEQYTPRQMLRLRAFPGVTNLPAIRGRLKLSLEQRIDLDLEYVENWSLWLDLQILWKTIWVVLSQEGVYEEQSQEPQR
jgi:lipopolysaccharide/colanic/teichoic acid biosynthesis glycosyltransferase